MKIIKILCVGKIKEKYFRDGIEFYIKQIRKKYPVEIVECADEPTPEGASENMEETIRKVEGKRLLDKIREEDYVIALCIEGKHYDTQAWRKRLERCFLQTEEALVFVIGGSLGLPKEVVKRADETLSFSAMTFPHQMMRLILCEQLAEIINGCG